MNKDAKIYIAGHRGLVGSAIVRRLTEEGYKNLIYKKSTELNLTRQSDVEEFFSQEKPEYVFLAAAKVGGIGANIESPADFLLDNLQIQNSVISSCIKFPVKKLCFLGSSCIYPKQCQQPMKEEYLLSGPLEPTNEGYALAKIAGLKLVSYAHKQYGLNAICPMPCNLYGKGDSFDLKKSHVLSALVRRFTDAKISGQKEVTLWGTGAARREFLHVEDLARIVVKLMKEYNSPEWVNIGSGKDISIKELAEMIAQKTEYSGQIIWDTSKPDGMMKKCLDVSRMLDLGYKVEISLSEGIDRVINEYKTEYLDSDTGEEKGGQK